MKWVTGMIGRFYNEPRSDINRKLIKSMLVGTTIFLIITVIDILFIDLLPISNLGESVSINSMNYVLGIISVACCAVYYYMYKSNEFFILNLSYISIAMEYMFVNIILNNSILKEVFTLRLIMLPFLFRAILLTLAILNNSKVVKGLLKRKDISVIITIIVTISSIILEMIMYSKIESNDIYNIILVINDLIVVYYYILLVLLAKRCLEKNQFIYTIIITSLSVFNMRRVYIFESISLNNKDIFSYRRGLAFIGFTILLIGLFIEIIRKIKENEKLTKELKNNEKMLLTITENIKDLIITEDYEGNITYVNNAVVANLGYTKEELSGVKFESLIQSEKNIIDSKKEDIEFKEQEWKTKLNGLLTVESIVSNIIEEKDGLCRIIVARDCSFRDKLEKLEKKCDELKEVENIRSQFFANLSHEFKTPINIIYSCIQMLDTYKNFEDKILADGYRKYDKTIKQNCFRMLRLINNLVDITKIDSGFIKIKLTNYDIVSLVENITLSTIPYAKSKNINLVFDTLVEELEIKCSPEYIERIILNLLSNAVKFTDDGGNILVFIDSNEEWVTIKIKDDGIGIPTELREIIFERFMQIDKSFKRAKEGSGIGLALVKSLVELQDGKIYLNSDNITGGSEFIIKLPNEKIDLKEVERENFEKNSSKFLVDTVSIEFSDIYEIL